MKFLSGRASDNSSAMILLAGVLILAFAGL
jgi:hypothetical protein